MKCFNHPNADAVGTCSQCGKGGCRDCIEDVGGALLCENCLNLHRQAHQEEEQSIAADRRVIMNRSKRIIAFTVILAIGGIIGAFSIASGQPNQSGVGIMVFGLGYCLPCMYLGVPKVWGMWRGFWKKIGCFLWATPIGWLILFVLFFYIPLVGGAVYGGLGGGIYEFVRHLRIARGKF